MTPDSGWCPLCAGIYSQTEISSGLLDPEEFERQRSLGYVRGENIEAPQVYALNGIVSSWAVWLFMNLVSGKEITFDGIAVDAKGFSARTWKEKRRTPNTCSYCGDDGIVMRGDDAPLVTRKREGATNAPLPLATVNEVNDSGAFECNGAGNTDYCGIRSLTGLDHLRY
ncbi:MAG: hypothetical protein IIB00_08405 [candidate division Zixibacteria bacterium]|nr:hypothetical protein [candidate division Zixibacteria bacterium]